MKIRLLFLSVVFVGTLLCSFADAAETRKKFIVLLSDWGNNGIPSEALAVMTQYPELKLSAAWLPDGKVPDAAHPLLRAGSIEPALVLPDEPVFPVIYNTVISTAPALSFSWPGDLWNIVVRGQEAMKTAVPGGSAGLFLRSEAFSVDLIDGLKKLGISWAAYRDTESSGAYIKDGFLLLAVQDEEICSFDALKDYIVQSTGPVVVARFRQKNPLSASLLAALGEYLRQDPSLSMATPAQLLKSDRSFLPPGDGAQSDVSAWLRRPTLIYKLSVARNAVEEYKNSGQAQPRILDALESEMYNLYRYDFLARLNDNPQPEDEQLFLVGLRNIYMLLKRPMPAELALSSDELPSAENTAELSVSVSASSVAFTNAASVDRPAGIVKFDVSLGNDTVVYSIVLGSALPAQVAVDIYMDMNNQRGAGLTNLLSGADGFLDPQDAWEFAFRIENDEVSLYRSGRFEPALIRKFTVLESLVIEISRSILRGNPLRWGYQAVLLERKAPPWKVVDFLCQDDGARRRILEKRPLQLPVIREKTMQ